MKKIITNVFAAVLLLLIPFVNYAQTAPNLGACSGFALFTAAGELTNSGASVITGDIASFDVTPVGFCNSVGCPGIVYGTIYPVGPSSNPAFADVSTAYSDMSTPTGSVIGVLLEGQILTPGVYFTGTGAAASLDGVLTLDGQNNPDAVFIIRVDGALSVGVSSNINLINSAQLCNVYWQINGQFQLGAGSVFRGTIIANGAIILLEGSSLYGRGLSTSGAIELHNNVVSFMPYPAGVITGSSTVCQEQTGVIYSVPAIINAATYFWTLPVGAIITGGAGTNSITVSFSASASSGSINVLGINSCGLGTVSANFSVIVNPSVASSVSIAAVPAGTICEGTSVTFTATPTNAVSPTYQWKKNSIDISGETGISYITTSLVNTNVISVEINSIASSCYASSTALSNDITMSVNPLPLAAGTITGFSSVCQGQIDVIYSVASITNATDYIWTLPSGATITAGDNTNSITVSFSVSAVSGDIKVQGSNSCGTGTISANYAVTVYPSVAPSVSIAAVPSGEICTGTSVVFTATPVDAVSPTYQWKKNGINISGETEINYTTTSLLNSNIISVEMNSTSTSCFPGSSVLSNNITMTVTSLPLDAGIIFGTSSICNGQTGLTYSVPIITNATSYIWTLPVGATITSGANTNSITVDFDETAVNGNITVQGSNSCGLGAVSANFGITIDYFPVAAGIITGSATACQGYSGLTYSVPVITNSTGYIWTLPVGVIITGGANTNTITVYFSSIAESGFITVQGSSSCGLGTVSANFAVAVNSLPSAAGIITGTFEICTEETGVIYSIQSIENAINYIWTLPYGATIISGNNTNIITVDFDQNAISGYISVQGSNYCGTGLASESYFLTVNTAPLIIAEPLSQTICEVGNMANFAVAAIGSGLTYQWRKGNAELTNSGNISGVNSNTLTINPVEITDIATDYNVVITGICEPSIISANISLSICYITEIGSDDNKNSKKIVTIYPNPFSTSIDIKINEESNINTCELKIYDASGKVVLNKILTKQLTTLSTDNFISGIYLYEVISLDKVIQSGKLISNQ